MSTTPTRPLIEMQIDGVWVDITEDVRLGSADSGGGIRIKRGRPNEGPIVEPTELDFTINNRHGKWSDQNPTGPYYGLLSRNQPVRASLDPVDEDFNRTYTDWWGETPDYTDTENVVQRGFSWHLSNASRFDMTPGLATIQSASGYTLAGFGTYADVDLTTRVKASDRTSEFGVILRMLSQHPSAQVDGTFESGAAGWTGSGGTLSVSSAVFKFGAQSGQVTVSGSPTQATIRPDSSHRLAVVVGGTYRVRAWVRCSAARTVNMSFDWYNAAQSFLSTTSDAGTALAANTWTLIEYTGTAPASAAFAAYGPTLASSPPNGTLLFVDNVEVIDFTVQSYYTAYLSPGSPDKLRIGKVTPGSAIAYQVDSPISNVVAGTWYRIRAQIAGQRLRMKFWEDGTDEPRIWWATYHDNTAPVRTSNPQTGEVGLFAKDGGALITFSEFKVRKWLAHTEVVSFPQRYDISRVDQWVPMQTRGILRRLGQGRKALEGAIRLHLQGYIELSALWLPLDSGSEDTTGNLIEGGPPGQIGGATFSSPETTGTAALAGATGILQLTDAASKLTGTTKLYGYTGAWTVLIFFRVPTTPASETELFRYLTTGTGRTFVVTLDSARAVHVKLYNSASDLIDDQYVLLYAAEDAGKWMAATLYLFQPIGDPLVHWAWNYHTIGSANFFTANGSYTGALGLFRTFQQRGSAVLSAAGGIELAHLFHYAGDLPFVTANFARAAKAYDTESTTTRFTRVCNDAGIRNSIHGDSAVATSMGPQLPIKRTELLADCADVEHGLIREDRDDFGLELVTRSSLYNANVIEFDIDSGHLTEPLDASPDDLATRNDVTVLRPGGSFAVSIQTEGPLNVNEPEDDPDGVGTYDEKVTINLGTDSLLPSAADWRRSLGTIPEPRYPQIRADLTSSAYQASEALAAVAASVDSGWFLDIVNGEVSPNKLRQLVQAYEVTIDQYEWDISWTSSPGPTYTVGVIGYTTRVQPAGIVLASSFAVGTDSSMLTQVADSSYDRWVPTATDPEVADFDIMVAGVRFHVNSITGSSDPQTLLVDVVPTNLVPTTANLVIGTGSRVTLAEPWRVAW